MSDWVRAIAIDYDGTLTSTGVPDMNVLAALEACRRQGRLLVLVTGRILEELRTVFPVVDDWFDAIVAENGAVLDIDGTARVLAAPVELALDEALVARSIPFRRGQVLLATHAAHEQEVFDEVRRLGLECQLVRNRGELMVLPPGVSKGTGAYEAFGELGVSHHSAIAVGDAENDHSLLRTCEIGVAVENAVDSLKRQADIVLEEPAGKGLEEFLGGPVVTGATFVQPRQWQIRLGRFLDGSPTIIPASQVNILIVGRSGSGKSFLANIISEQLIHLSYSIFILDAEGDYTSLAGMRGMLSLGGEERLPTPEDVDRFIRHRFGSVTLDLSLTDDAAREKYLPPLFERLEAERMATGLPHWLILDEAHKTPKYSSFSGRSGTFGKGYCFLTYRPEEFSEQFRHSIDVILGLPGGTISEPDHMQDPLDALQQLYQIDMDSMGTDAGKHAFIVRPAIDRVARPFILDRRKTHHVRHWHKYFTGMLPAALQFLFRTASGELRHTARNVGELHRILIACERDVLRNHADRGDLSRWLRKAVQDETLANDIQVLERKFARSPKKEDDIEWLRSGLVSAIETRYIDSAG